MMMLDTLMYDAGSVMAIDYERQLGLLWKFSLMANEHVRQSCLVYCI